MHRYKFNTKNAEDKLHYFAQSFAFLSIVTVLKRKEKFCLLPEPIRLKDFQDTARSQADNNYRSFIFAHNALVDPVACGRSQQYRACGNLKLSQVLHLTYLCLTTVPRPWQITSTLKLLFVFTKMALAFIKTGYLLTTLLKIGNEKR